ncbi:MAG: DUF1643 domain-containing protein [Clostridia bacterium]|nr:DUF1643 domain-containing protein [Clostridia bacterium]
MHIPASSIAALSVQPFDQALQEEAVISKPYDHERWLYLPCRYTEYRYILGTRGQKPLICIGVNPSTAEPGNLDNTLKSVERIAKNNGFDSFVMFNVYAQRATSPDDMDKTLDPRLHRENMRAFDWLLSRSGDNPTVWAAWGAVIEKRGYLPDCVREMITIGQRYGANWVTAGKRSKRKGHPHHPLYLKSDSPLDPFSEVEEYLLSLQ